MQHPLEGVAAQIEFFSRNLAYNLDFIPDDKLDWKPAPSASSAMEIVQHLLMVQARVGALLQDNNPDEAPIASPRNRDQAKQALIESAVTYAAVVRAIDPATLGDILQTPFGAMPRAFIAGLGPGDTIHHHGQIAYVQSLLGDTEPHFDPSLIGG